MNKNAVNGNVAYVIFNPLNVPDSLSSQFLHVQEGNQVDVLEKPKLDFIDETGYGWDCHFDYVYTGQTPDDVVLHVSHAVYGSDFVTFHLSRPMEEEPLAGPMNIDLDLIARPHSEGKSAAKVLADILEKDGFLKADIEFYERLQKAIFNAFTDILCKKIIELSSTHQQRVWLAEDDDHNGGGTPTIQ